MSNQETDTDDSTLYPASARQDNNFIMKDDSKRQEDDTFSFLPPTAHVATILGAGRSSKKSPQPLDDGNTND
jgi:hypothetical protein